MSFLSTAPRRLDRLQLPECQPIIGTSAQQADLTLLAAAPAGHLDTTHFDTRRFPPPPWALDAFVAASEDGALAYTGYRGDKSVLGALAGSVGDLLEIQLDPNRNILLTPGTQAGLFAALSALVESGNRVALMDPDYLFTARIVRFLGDEIGHVPIRSYEGDPLSGDRVNPSGSDIRNPSTSA